MDEAEKREIRAEFGRIVSTGPAELGRWREAERGGEVGWIRGGEREPVRHQEGRRIVGMRRKQAADPSGDDRAHIRQVAGYCRHRLARRPDGDVSGTRRRYSPMRRGTTRRRIGAGQGGQGRPAVASSGRRLRGPA